MNLVFVEEPEQIACALAIAGNDSLLVAMAPNVMFALKKEKRSFVIPEDYYDNNDLQKEWHAYFALSNSIISRVDDWIVSYNGISFPNALIRPLEFNAQMFFNMFRQIVVSIFVLEKIFAKENPKKIDGEGSLRIAVHSYDESKLKGFVKDTIPVTLSSSNGITYRPGKPTISGSMGY